MSEIVLQIDNGSIFQGDTLVLHSVNMELKQGEFVYLIGKTGSGKSSLLKTLYGALPLKGGTGSVGSFQLNTLKKKQIPFLRREIGIVFQDFQLLNDRDVRGNLRFVLQATGWKDKPKIEQRIDDVLTDVGLASKGYKMPFELSGGEQQRVVIARALLNHPKLILADEPTGNLDPETSSEIMKLLVALTEQTGSTTLMATHDYRLIEEFPSRILRCEHETIIPTETL